MRSEKRKGEWKKVSDKNIVLFLSLPHLLPTPR
jgi:hypothetical protein